MVDVGSWYDQSCREAARCSMRVADVGRGHREAARFSMRVADVVEDGRSMSRFLKYIGLTRGGGSMWLLVSTASHTWTRSCNAGACRRCGRQSVQRVVRGLDAALLEHVKVEVGVVGVGRSMSQFLKYIGLIGDGSMWLLVHTPSRTWTRSGNAGACHRCGRQSVQRVICGLDAALLEHVIVGVGRSMSQFLMYTGLTGVGVDVMLAAWSRRVERVLWLRLNRVLALWTDGNHG